MSETTVEMAAPTSAPTPSEPQTFHRDYVHMLREEARTLRQRAQGHETARLEAEKAAAAVRVEAEQAIAQARAEAETRIKHAELRAHAIKAGIVDLDALKLLDASALKMNEAGEVEGADALIAEAKKAKPYLFGAANTSNPTAPPAPKPQTKKSALEMTDAEFEAAMRNKAWRS
jgi:hypothetical protein